MLRLTLPMFLVLTLLTCLLLFPGILLAEGTNDPPVLLIAPEVSPDIPKTCDNLDVSYGYFDNNNDIENGTIIKWYKVGDSSPVVENIYENGDETAKVLLSNNTTKGEQWYATVQPCDGTDYGEVYTSNTVTIANTAPMLVDGVSISPSNPKAGDSLGASYTFYDYDEGDIEDGTQIRWYKNGSLQEQYNDSSQLPPDAVRKGEEWQVTVKPSDGTDYGSLYTSAGVTIANSKPAAENVAIAPDSPKASDNLALSYSYNDIDSDEESGTEIRWYADEELMAELDGMQSVDSSYLEKGQSWQVKVKPCDGEEFGQEVASGTVSIGNSIPTLSGVEITPGQPVSVDSLHLNYSYNDVDGDPEGGVEICWYKNSEKVEALDGLLTISPDDTSKGESWYATIKISDGTEFSQLYTATSVTIQNSLPETANVLIQPGSPDSGDTLTVSYDYSDVDGDPEDGTEIRWYKDGSVVEGLDGKRSVGSGYLEEGQSWQVKVKPCDGEEFGQEVASGTVSIGNSIPTLSGVEITPGQPVSVDSLHLNYSYNDVDGDPEGGVEICWYKNSEKVEALDGLLTISPDDTSKGESWYATIKISDGTEFSQLYTATSVTIQNSLPETANVLIQPGSPDSGDTLTVSYDYSDVDGDPEDGTEIRWYKDGSVVEGLDGKRSVGSGYLEEGQSWQVKIKPNDGSSWGTEIVSGTVEIAKKEESPPRNPAPVEVVEESTEENEPGNSTEELPGEKESSKEDRKEDKKEEKDKKDSSQKVEQEAEQPSPEDTGEDGETGDPGAGNEITEVLNFDNGNFKVKLDNSIKLKVFRRLFNSYSSNIISNVYTIWAEEEEFSNLADSQVGVRVYYSGDFNNPVLAAWNRESERWVEIEGKLIGNFLTVPLGEINGKRICIFDKLFNYYKKYIEHVKSYNLFPAIGDTSLSLYVPSLTFKENTEIEIERIVIPSNPINKEVFKIEAGAAAGNPVEAYFNYSELNENPKLAYWDKDRKQWRRKPTIKVDDMYIKGEIDRWGLWTILDSK